MNSKVFLRRALTGWVRSGTAVVCSIVIAGGDAICFAQDAGSTAAQSTKIPNEKLDSLVAPIALYSDPLLGQVLVASTYPLEIVQLGSGWTRTKT